MVRGATFLILIGCFIVLVLRIPANVFPAPLPRALVCRVPAAKNAPQLHPVLVAFVLSPQSAVSAPQLLRTRIFRGLVARIALSRWVVLSLSLAVLLQIPLHEGK